MKQNAYAKKLAYIGAGCGIVLFAIFGLLPGSFLGGVMGLNVAHTLLGSPMVSGVASRVIVAISMIAGVMVSGIMSVTASALAGWTVGTIIDTISAGRRELAEAKQNK